MSSLDIKTDVVLVVQKYPLDLVVLSPRVGGSREEAAVLSQGVWEVCVCMCTCTCVYGGLTCTSPKPLIRMIQGARSAGSPMTFLLPGRAARLAPQHNAELPSSPAPYEGQTARYITQPSSLAPVVILGLASLLCSCFKAPPPS